MTGSSLLLRDVRVVDLDRDLPASAPQDVVVEQGRITAVGSALTAPAGAPTVEGGGRFVIPGLWDQHVHLDQWALGRLRIDTSPATCAADVVALVRDRVQALDARGDLTTLVQGYGHRSPDWDPLGTATDLDTVCGDHPVVLISGDAHHGWLSTQALARLGLPSGPGRGLVEENAWFDAYARLDEVFGPDPHLDEARADVLADAVGRGVTGIVDLEFGGAWQWWPERAADTPPPLRVRAGTYADRLDEVLAQGLRSGDPLDPSGRVTMGPLKLITDGSLNTRTAYCCAPYSDDPTGGRGVQNFTPEQLVDLLGRAHTGGLTAAVHAIGDAAVGHALDAFAATGVVGAVEHAQLMAWEDVPRLAELGVTASVQPAHLLDDRDVTDQCWADRTDRCFVLRSMLDAGATLAMGSDAPVAPLDPWLAIAAAVHRTGDDRDPWHPEQSLTVREALAASVDGQRVRVGGRGDLALIDLDPVALQGDPGVVSARLRAVRASLTVVGGEVVHGA